MPRKLHFGLAPLGVGGPGQDGLWKDARVAKNASIDIRYYIELAQLAERAKFDTFFVVDSQFINETYPAHYLNRLEPLTHAVGGRHSHHEYRSRRHREFDVQLPVQSGPQAVVTGSHQQRAGRLECRDKF